MTQAHGPSTLVRLLVAALLLSACGSPTVPGARGTGPLPAATTSTPTMEPPVAAVPPAPDPVTGVGTVIEAPGRSPELCLGPVRESFPPQCEGIHLAGWSWAQYPPEQSVDGAGSATRWGSYAVTGSFDGTTLTATGAVPLALHDTIAEPAPRPITPPELTAEQWADVESGTRLLPGLLTSAREGDTGPVHVDVVHDDGSLQAWADASFGAGAVAVRSALR